MVHYIAYEWPMAARHASQDGSMPLHNACEASLPFSVVKYIMDLYEQANMIPNELGMWPIHLACFHECSVNVTKYMLQVHPELKDKKTKGGLLAVHLAAEFPRLKLFQLFVQTASNDILREVCPEGNTVLHIACANDASLECIEYLTKSYKPPIEMVNQKGDMPLHVALKEPKSSKSKKNKLQVIEYLVQNYWNATATTNRNGNLPIHIACGNKAPLEIIEFLVNTNQDSLKRQTTNPRNNNHDGLTPLHVACQVKAKFKVITFLVHQWKGALLVPTLVEQELPIHLSVKKHASLQVIQYLARRCPESLQKTNAQRQTPAAMAAADDESKEEVVKWLQAVTSGKLSIQPSLREQFSSSFSFRPK